MPPSVPVVDLDVGPLLHQEPEGVDVAPVDEVVDEAVVLFVAEGNVVGHREVDVHAASFLDEPLQEGQSRRPNNFFFCEQNLNYFFLILFSLHFYCFL